MAKRHYCEFHTLMQRIASTRFGSWLFARISHQLDRAFLKLTRGRTAQSSLLTGVPVVMMTTRGAKSGLLRTVPLPCIRDEADPRTFALIASNWGQLHDPAWYYNLKATSHARCSMGAQTAEYVAHEATGEEYEKLWRFAVDTYFGYRLYQQRTCGRQIPIMVMSPAQHILCDKRSQYWECATEAETARWRTHAPRLQHARGFPARRFAWPFDAI